MLSNIVFFLKYIYYIYGVFSPPNGFPLILTRKEKSLQQWVMGFDFTLVNKLRIQLVAISQMLTEDPRLPSQRPRTFFTHGTVSGMASCFHLCPFASQISWRSHSRRETELRIPPFYSKQKAHLFFVLQGDILSSLKVAHCKRDPEKWPRQTVVRALHSWHTQQDMWETHGGLLSLPTVLVIPLIQTETLKLREQITLLSLHSQ